MSRRALVIGAGVSGLTTAIVLAERGHDVLVVAEEPQGTTSRAAGAMCGPGFAPSGSPESRWEKISKRNFRELADEEGTGVDTVNALLVAQTSGPVPPLDPVYEARPCDPAELPPGFGTGLRVRTQTADMPTYLSYLSGRLRHAGSRIEQRRVAHLRDAAGEAPLVVNCAGIGARELAEDPDLFPVRGQHVVVDNPGIDTLYFQMTLGSSWVSWMPHGGEVVLGGIAQAGDDRMEIDAAVAEQILAGAVALEPRFAEAEVIEHRVGLRPTRPSVRLEAETVDRARCVHNYGHGGMGVSWSWGCAVEAADLLLSN